MTNAVNGRIFIHHFATPGYSHKENGAPYCCECDYCESDGITCNKGAVHVICFAVPNEPDHWRNEHHILVCDNHLACAFAEAMRFKDQPDHYNKMVAVHNVYNSEYKSGAMPEGTGWQNEKGA